MEFRWKQPLGLAQCPYMERWVLDLHFFSIRIHYWFASDDDLHMHDHAWWFISWVIAGSYTDVGSKGTVHRPRWSIAYWDALHRHGVIALDSPIIYFLSLMNKYIDKIVTFMRKVHVASHYENWFSYGP